MRRWLSKSSNASRTLGLAAFCIPALQAYGESSLKTRVPSESQEIDRDDNGKVDSYREEFRLGNGLTLLTAERLNEDTRAIEVRVTMILSQGQDLWTESWNSSLRERSSTVSRNCPFDVSMGSSASSGETTVTLLDDPLRFVAILIREEDGRYAPVTDEELARVGKLSQAVSDFAMGVLDRAEELKHDKDEADKLIRNLEQSVEEYSQDASTDDSNESENKAQKSK